MVFLNIPSFGSLLPAAVGSWVQPGQPESGTCGANLLCPRPWEEGFLHCSEPLCSRSLVTARVTHLHCYWGTSGERCQCLVSNSLVLLSNTPLKENYNPSTLVAFSWIEKLMCLKVSLIKNSIHHFLQTQKVSKN